MDARGVSQYIDVPELTRQSALVHRPGGFAQPPDAVVRLQGQPQPPAVFLAVRDGRGTGEHRPATVIRHAPRTFRLVEAEGELVRAQFDVPLPLAHLGWHLRPVGLHYGEGACGKVRLPGRAQPDEVGCQHGDFHLAALGAERNTLCAGAFRREPGE